jgi:protein-L-isoaspartate O-methyltransferase
MFLASMDAEINGIGMRGVTTLASSHGDAGVMALGPMIMIALLLKPATLVLAITAADGYVRASTALISQEVYSTVWLAAPERLIRAAYAWLNPPQRTSVRLFKDES